MFELAQPLALGLLVVPFGLWFLLPRAVQALPAALKVPFYNDLSTLLDQKKQVSNLNQSFILFFCIWTLIVFALAGPRWVGQPVPIAREGHNIMLALDISGSMELDDMLLKGRPVTRLFVVKRAAENFIEERKGDRIGLILFGTRAYLQTPLTYDRHTVLTRIEDATVGLAGKTTSIGDAIGLAVKRLQDVPKQGRVIILLTDGANNTGILKPLKAAELAKDDQIKIYTIGLGSEMDPRAIGGLFMQFNSSSDLDEETLQQIAAETGGRYFRATNPKSLEKIYNTINQLETIKYKEAEIRPQHDYYPWFAGLALFLFMGWLLVQTGYLHRAASLFAERGMRL